MRIERSASGQGLTEAGFGIMTASLLLTLLIATGVNAYALMTYDAKVRFIAKEASRCLKEQIWCDGMERPVAHRRLELQQRIDRVVSTLKKSMSLPGELEAEFVDPAAQLEKSGEASNNVLCSVTITATKLPMPFSLGLFAQETSIARTFHSLATSFAPMAVCNLEDSSGRGIQVPAYFFYRRKGQTITRERYTGGRGLNLGEGTFLSGFICSGQPDEIRYTPGNNGTWHHVPFDVGHQHGSIASEAYPGTNSTN